MQAMKYHQSTFIDDRVRNLVDDVLLRGDTVESRYGPSREIIGGRLNFQSGGLVTRKHINYSLGWMELLQLLAGVYDLNSIIRVAPFADHSLFTYSMAYGPRVHTQIPEIIEVLKENPNSRQAVVFVARPGDGPTNDLPCTLTIQFLLRNGRLNAVVSMRSWDLCRGLPYDLMMFSGILEAVSQCVNVPSGLVMVTAGSTHIYMNQMEKVPRTSPKKWRFLETGPKNWQEFQGWAANNIPYLERGGTPGLIEVYQP